MPSYGDDEAGELAREQWHTARHMLPGLSRREAFELARVFAERHPSAFLRNLEQLRRPRQRVVRQTTDTTLEPGTAPSQVDR